MAVRAGFGMGSVATGAFSTVPGLLLLPYLTDELGIAAAIAGAIVFLPKGWDVIANPLVGRFSDKWGRRRPFLLIGGVALAVTFFLVFAGPRFDSPALAGVWVTVAFLLAATAYAAFQVPYFTMTSEITSSYDERTRLLSWRVAILSLTILVAGALAPAIQAHVGGAEGYRAMAAFIAVLILVGAVGAFMSTRRTSTAPIAQATGGLLAQFRVVAGAREFRILMLCFTLQAVGTSTMLAAIAYVTRWILHSPGVSSLLFVAFVGPAILLTPVWSIVGRRIGKMRAWIIGSAIWAVAVIAMSAAVFTGLLAVTLLSVVAGAGYAAMQMFPQAILPDIAAADSEATGQNRRGLYFGVWTGAETLGLAIGPGLFALLLTIGGYISGADSEVAAQPAEAVTAITVGFSIIPVLFIGVSLLILRRFRQASRSLNGSTAP